MCPWKTKLSKEAGPFLYRMSAINYSWLETQATLHSPHSPLHHCQRLSFAQRLCALLQRARITALCWRAALQVLRVDSVLVTAGAQFVSQGETL